MADKCDLCLLGLIVLSSLLSGSSGVDDDDHVFISSGGNVRLSCNNALSDCTSTTWTHYNRFRHSAAVELINGGMKKNNTERNESLSLGSDCSLNITNVTIEDHGLYTCRQYVNGVNGQKHHQGPDAPVYLHVLHVSPSSSSSSSSSQTEISPGRSVTLSCQLYSGYSCDDRVRSEDIELLWVNQAGVDLQTDSRYQISAPDRCIITLTTTLLNEDHNREWRCEVTHRKQLKTSVTHTVKSSDDASEHSSPAVDSSTLSPVSSSNSQKKSSSTTSAAPTQENQKSLTTRSSERTTATHTPVFTAQQATSLTSNSLNQGSLSVIVIVAVLFVLLLPALILWLIRKKRAGNRSGTDDSVGRTDDVTYTEVTAYSKNPDKKNKVRCDDKVTYASIRGANAGVQLYASVNKNHHKSVQ